MTEEEIAKWLPTEILKFLKDQKPVIESQQSAKITDSEKLTPEKLIQLQKNEATLKAQKEIRLSNTEQQKQQR